MSEFDKNADLSQEMVDGDDAMGNPESEKTMSLMGGVAGFDSEGDGYDDFGGAGESAGSKMLGHGTLVIFVILFIGAGTLYAMRVTQREIKSTLDPGVAAMIEGFLIKTSDPMSMDANDPLRQSNIKSLIEDTDDILATFSTDPTEHQVPIEYVKKNPFMLKLFKRNDSSVVVDSGQASRDKMTLEREARYRRVEKEYEGLVIQSVMWGKNPVAIVNNELYQEGQQIGSFTIIKVNKLSVELAAEGRMFVLEMERQYTSQSPRKRLNR